MLTNFESAIERDSSKSPVPGGGIHPLTHNAMNYLTLLAEYKGILSDIIAEWPLRGQPHLPETYSKFDCESYSSAISARIALPVLLLLCKLDGKARLHKDLALSYLFLANNLQYVISKVRQSNLKDLLGYHWLAQHEVKVKQYVASYERIGWSRAIQSLPEDELHPNGAWDCFRRFNMEFEAAYRKQLNYTVPDPKLRDEIKMSLSEKLLPAYAALYNSHSTRALSPRRDALRESIVGFSPEDLRDYLSDLFHEKGSHSSSSAGRPNKGRSH